MSKLIIGSVFLLTMFWVKNVDAQFSAAFQKFQVFFVPGNSLNHNSASFAEVSDYIQKKFQKNFPK